MKKYMIPAMRRGWSSVVGFNVARDHMGKSSDPGVRDEMSCWTVCQYGDRTALFPCLFTNHEVSMIAMSSCLLPSGNSGKEKSAT